MDQSSRVSSTLLSSVRGTDVKRTFSAAFFNKSFFLGYSTMPPKQVCKFFQQGNCRFGNSCKYLHTSGLLGFGSQRIDSGLQAFQSMNPIDLASTIQADLKELPNFQLKPTLTTYGLNHYTTNSLIEGRDMSPEELRLQYMEAIANNSLDAYNKNLELRQKDMEYCIKEIKAKDSLAARYQQVGTTRKELIKPFIPKTLEQSINDLQNSAAFGGSDFGNSGGFGSSGFGSSGFGNSGAFGAQNTSAFGLQSSQPSAFGQQNTQKSAFGAQNTPNSAFGNQNTSNSAFGSQNNQTSAFGQGAFGNQISAFGQSGFGNTDKKNSAFGSSGFGSLSNSAFGSQNTGGAFGAQNTGGAFGSQTTGNGAFGSQNTSGGGAFGSQSKPAGGAFGTQNSGSGAFGSQNTAGGGAFGSQNTTGGGAFGSQNTAGGAFGSQNSAGTGAFGAQSGSGQSAFSQKQPQQSSGFGQSGFGQSGFGQSVFGQSGSGQTGFGQLGFGNTSTGGANSLSKGFGQSGFGSSQANSAFGQNTSNSGFGANKTPEPSAFGQSGFGASKPSGFGGQTQPQSAFGQASSNTASAFGTPVLTSFGQQPATGSQATPASQNDSGFGGFSTVQSKPSTSSKSNGDYPPAYNEPAFKLGEVPEIPPPLEICF